MSARILVVDDVPANVKLLEARLSAEYFDVLTASNGTEALEICARAECDIILLDVMMPDMDGFEVCRRLKSNPATHFIPVVIVTALDSPADRVRGLESGADDFLTKPVSDVVLIARVRSLTRLKMMTDELRMRAITSLEIGMQAPERSAIADKGTGGRILLVDDRPSSYEKLAPILSAEHTVDVETNPSEALFHAAEANYDLLIVSLSLDNFDGLRLCSQARSLERTRQVPILAISDADNNARLMRGLEIGVNDYLLRPVDKNELLARARTQIRRRRYTDHLRDNVQNSIEMAITDALTGLNNRRYMESHLATLAEQASIRGKPLALMILDIDYFKAINDTYGHDAGDDVLREFAVRIRKSIRGIDLACRYGGEEFVIVMPETDLHVAGMVAERLRRSIAGEPFAVDKGGKRITVTISIGLTTLERKGEQVSDVLKRADTALYRAKHDGRNRVVSAAA
ncbi:PleD family two-component system response regulator [Bradyrhizobium sp. Pear76]|uniref:PleD family two-component system response regulator n=1 Tax=Bradyrhizobium oropedii TaxID=1571201 RepID=UPI001E531C84|nr:PleD family two-component system response regulator [Bradyrhizobium oropedii]MCC8966447.1 PleD family two-component system response regulator [Bradyrhizobium oropedii]